MSHPSHRQVVSQLQGARKSDRGAAGYSRWVNRPLGRQLAAVSFRRGLTPNQVSLISAVFTGAGIVLIAVPRPSWVSGISATVLLLVGYGFDSADGQLARLRGGGSPAGEWLDHVLDALKICAIHLAVVVCWYRFYDSDVRDRRWLLVPLGFTVVAVTFFVALLLADLLRRIELARSGAPPSAARTLDPNEPAPVLRSLVVLPNDYGVLAIAMVALCAHGVFRVLYTLLFAANTVFLVAGCVRWFREMGTLRRAV